MIVSGTAQTNVERSAERPRRNIKASFVMLLAVAAALPGTTNRPRTNWAKRPAVMMSRYRMPPIRAECGGEKRASLDMRGYCPGAPECGQSQRDEGRNRADERRAASAGLSRMLLNIFTPREWRGRPRGWSAAHDDRQQGDSNRGRRHSAIRPAVDSGQAR